MTKKNVGERRKYDTTTVRNNTTPKKTKPLRRRRRRPFRTVRGEAALRARAGCPGSRAHNIIINLGNYYYSHSGGSVSLRGSPGGPIRDFEKICTYSYMYTTCANRTGAVLSHRFRSGRYHVHEIPYIYHRVHTPTARWRQLARDATLFWRECETEEPQKRL